jgi:hypothetical protein
MASESRTVTYVNPVYDESTFDHPSQDFTDVHLLIDRSDSTKQRDSEVHGRVMASEDRKVTYVNPVYDESTFDHPSHGYTDVHLLIDRSDSTQQGGSASTVWQKTGELIRDRLSLVIVGKVVLVLLVILASCTLIQNDYFGK